MTDTKEVVTLVLEDTAATRSYPFTRATLDQIKELRHDQEDQLKEETGKEHLVPAPVIIAQAIDAMHRDTFN